jgi:hypothetical protein
VHKASESLTLLFFYSHLTSSKSFKIASHLIKISIMASQRRRQLKLTSFAVAVAAIDKRRRQRQEINNQRSRAIEESN